MRVESVKHLFRVLNEHGVKYVAVENWDALPDNDSGEIVLLAENRDVLQQLIAATQVNKSRYQVMFENGTIINMKIYQKGQGFLPERFETKLLENVVIHNDAVKAPDFLDGLNLSLYRWLYHYGINLTPSERKCWVNWIEQQIGVPVKPSPEVEITLQPQG